jgi:hypothetical protein
MPHRIYDAKDVSKPVIDPHWGTDYGLFFCKSVFIFNLRSIHWRFELVQILDDR